MNYKEFHSPAIQDASDRAARELEYLLKAWAKENKLTALSDSERKKGE